MAKNINDFKIFVEFCSNKVQSGNSVDPVQFNEIANRAQMQLFEKDYALFLVDGFVTDFLSVFQKNQSIVIDSFGNGGVPSDYEHAAEMRAYYVPPVGKPYEREVKKENSTEWGKMQTSKLFRATKFWPKYTTFAETFKFLPRDLGLATLDYFKTPIKPVWGYTIVSNDAVYNPATSTNFEWNDYSTNQVAGMYLALIGVNLKDGELSQFAEMYKAQNDK